jgi:hypothetical protein
VPRELVHAKHHSTHAPPRLNRKPKTRLLRINLVHFLFHSPTHESQLSGPGKGTNPPSLVHRPILLPFLVSSGHRLVRAKINHSFVLFDNLTSAAPARRGRHPSLATNLTSHCKGPPSSPLSPRQIFFKIWLLLRRSFPVFRPEAEPPLDTCANKRRRKICDSSFQHCDRATPRKTSCI